MFGAIDMRLTPAGDYVFFEINPGGQFMYIEAASGLPIAEAMAMELLSMDETRPARAAENPLRASV